MTYLHFYLLQSETFIISFPASSSLSLVSAQRWTNTTAVLSICQALQVQEGKHYKQGSAGSEIKQVAKHDKKLRAGALLSVSDQVYRAGGSTAPLPQHYKASHLLLAQGPLVKAGRGALVTTA